MFCKTTRCIENPPKDTTIKRKTWNSNWWEKTHVTSSCLKMSLCTCPKNICKKKQTRTRKNNNVTCRSLLHGDLYVPFLALFARFCAMLLHGLCSESTSQKCQKIRLDSLFVWVKNIYLKPFKNNNCPGTCPIHPAFFPLFLVCCSRNSLERNNSRSCSKPAFWRSSSSIFCTFVRRQGL